MNISGNYDHIISLGGDCMIKQFLTEMGYLKRKSDGAKTFPFDLAIHPYKSVVELLTNNFNNYIATEHIDMNEEHQIYNKLFDVIFLHESPKWSDVDFDYCWSKQQSKVMNFSDNEYYQLKKRYMDRIENFKECLSEDGKFLFIYHTKTNDHPQELYDALRFNVKKHEDFTFIMINTSSRPEITEYDRKNGEYPYYYYNIPLKEGIWNSNTENVEIVKNKLKIILKSHNIVLKNGHMASDAPL